MMPLPALFQLSSRHLLSGAVGLALAGLGGQALADARGGTLQLDNVEIDGKRHKTYKAERSASAKYAQPLLDTPQTITVVPQEVIQDQKALSLREVLSNVSGITFNAGEGGAGSGDSINIRGFSASANMQIDGLRDSAQNNRTDTFNIEQVEVIKGPNSVFGGAGTTGGAVNQISKQPLADSFTRLGAGLGTDSYQRLTLDTNQPLEGVGTNSAWRLNLMAHENDVPDRKHIDRQRWGIAPSLALGLGEDTRLTLSYFHQRDDNQPDYGVPTSNGKRVPGVSRDTYFGWRNLDKEEIRSDALTLKLEHQFDEDLSLQSLTRYSEIQRDTVISAAHVNVRGLPPGKYRPAGPQAYGRDVTSRMWINQTSLAADFDTLGFGHNFIGGVELSRETYDRDVHDYGLDFPVGGFDLASPPGYWRGPTNKAASTKVETRLFDRALYAFDTIALHRMWDLNLGLRYDWVDGDADNWKLGAGKWTRTHLGSSDERLSSRAGLVFKPVDQGRIYLAYGNSFNPSAENLATSGAGLSTATEKLGPEKNRTWELGSKWELLARRLGLDAAIFRVEKRNARQEMTDGSTVLAGEQRVQGVELAATGRLTEQWSLFANFTYLDSEIRSAGDTPKGLASEGQALANTPPRSFNLWTTYDLPGNLRIGYGVRYVSERNLTASNDRIKLDDYWLHNAMLGYKATDNLDLQLNINNLFDKDYVERVRTQLGTRTRSSAVEYGDARAAILSATLSF